MVAGLSVRAFLQELLLVLACGAHRQKGIDVVKESRNFRLDPEVRQQLQVLAAKWGVSQAQVVEILVREAARENRQLRAVKNA